MQQKIKMQEENKKHNAFKRFSQIGLTGLAVMSLSAFSTVSAKQMPAKVENGSFVKVENDSLKRNTSTTNTSETNAPFGNNWGMRISDDPPSYTETKYTETKYSEAKPYGDSCSYSDTTTTKYKECK